MGNEILCGIAVPQKMHRLDFSPRRGPRVDGGNDFLQRWPRYIGVLVLRFVETAPLENFNFLDLEPTSIIIVIKLGQKCF